MYYEDTDAVGIVYYANYLKYMERSRTECLRSYGICLTDMVKNNRAMFVVKNVNIDYKRPAKLDDLVNVTVNPDHIGHASIIFQQEIILNSVVLCAARVTLVSVDTKTMKPRILPEECQDLINAFNLEMEGLPSE